MYYDMYVLHYVFIFIYTNSYVKQGWRKWSGGSSFGQTSFSQGKNKIPFLQKASNQQKCYCDFCTCQAYIKL